MADAYSTYSGDEMAAPASSCVAITAGATEIVATRGVFCNTAGAFTVRFVGDTSTVELTLLAGVVYPFRVNQVTAGTGLFALR
jgi:hypothetical protein